MAKFFHLITSFQLGGTEIIAFNLAEHCKLGESEDIEFIVAELYTTKSTYSIEKKQELALKKIKTISLSKSSKRFSLIVAPFSLVYHLLKQKPQVIHSHTDLPDFVLSVSLRILSLLHIKGPKIVRTIHNTQLWPTHKKLGKYTESAFSNDIVVGVSDACLEAYKNLRLKNHLPVSSHQYIIHNSCAIPEKRDHPFKIDREKINIAFCGRFEHQKGIDILIARIKEINIWPGNNFLFHIIGIGTYFHEVLRLSESNDNVLIYNTVPNIADKLYAFDFLIMPSRFEGLVLTSIEASLWKIPIIAAIAPGLNETLPPDWPLQFHLENKDELFSVLNKVKNNEYDLEALKNQAFSFVSENFSHKKMIDDYSKLYMEIYE